MKIAMAFGVVLTFLFSARLDAASLCNCCGEATVEACNAACAPVKPAAGQCVATLDPDARQGIAPDVNPLYEIPLRNVWLASDDTKTLELFRRLLERSRVGAERDRKAAWVAYRRGRIDQSKVSRLTKRYEDAIVNYYLGIQSYKLAKTAGK